MGCFICVICGGEELFDFEVEADVAGGDGEYVGSAVEETQEREGDDVEVLGGVMGEEGVVAGEEFVAAVAAEGNGDVFAGELGEEEGWYDRGVGEGFVEGGADSREDVE